MSQAICEATIAARAEAASRFAPLEADAELIRLCALIVEIEAEQERLWADTETIEDEHRIKPALTALYAKRKAVLKRIEDASCPTSTAGALAVARAALALANRDFDGNIRCENDGEWLAFCVVEFLIDGPPP